MQKIYGSNPFGVTTRIGLSATAAAKVQKQEEAKKVDLVGIYLATVPSLQKAKEELEQLKTSLSDNSTSEKCGEWVEQIVAIMEEILDYTKAAIRGEAEAASPAPVLPEAGAAAPAIDADMISGKKEIPAGILRTPPAA